MNSRRWIGSLFLSDQLNTHMSESLVRWIAQEQQYDQDLGVKGSSGILKSMASRRAFLETAHHRIRFVFTPKTLLLAESYRKTGLPNYKDM